MSIVFDNVYHIYGKGTVFEKVALNGISFTIEDGEFVGIIGHTGSGKSTLIQHMNGLLKCSSGFIYYNGKDINDDDYDRRKLRTDVGLVFQYPEHQLFEASVYKDVAFGPKNLGWSDLDVQLNSFNAIKSVGLSEDFLDVSPFDLSGGQKRRVAIAGVLAMKPSVLILDEPAAGLDPKGRREMLEMISQIRREKGITVVLVSHSMEDVAEYVDRIMVMNDASLVMDGTPAQIFSHAQELRDMGLDVPQVSRIMEKLVNAGFDGDPGIFDIDEAALYLRKKLMEKKGMKHD